MARIGLRRAGQGINLLVHRDRIEVVAEFRAEQLLLAIAGDLNAVVPVGQVFVLIEEPHVVAEILRALLSGFEERIVAGEHERRGEAVNQARDRVGLLQEVALLAAFELQSRAVVAVVDLFVRVVELPFQVRIRNRVNLIDPPIRLFVTEFLACRPGRRSTWLRTCVAGPPSK